MTATDAYRAWVAAHPSLDALTDEQKDHEAALAMGKPVCDDPECPGCDTEVIATPEGLRVDGGPWSPTADAAQAVDFAQATAEATGGNAYVTFVGWGTRKTVSASAGGLRSTENPSFPAALTTACLAARRAMMERE